MSRLTDALERIYTWFDKNKPDMISQLKPGLSKDEIEELVTDLPSKLPEEVYELYSWHNGSSGYNFLFDNYIFMPLNYAVSAYREQVNEIEYSQREETLFFKRSFPIFQLWCNGCVFYTLVLNEENKNSIRIYDSECSDYSLIYNNLTELILHNAEWLENCYFFELEETWDIEEDTRCKLNFKYMAREYILDLLARKQDSSICHHIYQQYLENEE